MIDFHSSQFASLDPELDQNVPTPKTALKIYNRNIITSASFRNREGGVIIKPILDPGINPILETLLPQLATYNSVAYAPAILGDIQIISPVAEYLDSLGIDPALSLGDMTITVNLASMKAASNDTGVISDDIFNTVPLGAFSSVALDAILTLGDLVVTPESGIMASVGGDPEVIDTVNVTIIDMANNVSELAVGVPHNHGVASFDGLHYIVTYADGNTIRALSTDKTNVTSQSSLVISDVKNQGRAYAMTPGILNGQDKIFFLSNQTVAGDPNFNPRYFEWRSYDVNSGIISNESIFGASVGRKDGGWACISADNYADMNITTLYGTVTEYIFSQTTESTATRQINADFTGNSGLGAVDMDQIDFPEFFKIFQLPSGDLVAVANDNGNFAADIAGVGTCQEITRAPSDNSWGSAVSIHGNVVGASAGVGDFTDQSYAANTSHAGQATIIQIADGRIYQAYISDVDPEYGFIRLVERGSGRTSPWTLKELDVSESNARHLALSSQGNKIWIYYIDNDAESLAYKVYDADSESLSAEIVIDTAEVGTTYNRLAAGEKFPIGVDPALSYTTVTSGVYNLHLAITPSAPDPSITLSVDDQSLPAFYMESQMIPDDITISPTITSSIPASFEPTLIAGNVTLIPELSSAIFSNIEPTVSSSNIIIQPELNSNAPVSNGLSASNETIIISPELNSSRFSTVEPTVLSDSITINVPQTITNTHIEEPVVDDGSTPAGIPVTNGLVLHMEVDNITVNDGDQPGPWTDQSPNGIVLSQNGNPIFRTNYTPTGQPAIEYDGLSDQHVQVSPLNGFPATNTPRTMFFVVDYDKVTNSSFGGFAYGTATNNQAFGLTLNGNNSQLTIQGWGGTHDEQTSISGITNTPGDGSDRGFIIHAVRYDGTTMDHYLNDTIIDTQTKNYNTQVSIVRIAANINSGQVPLKACAAILYNRALTPTEFEDVRLYLDSKYITP